MGAKSNPSPIANTTSFPVGDHPGMHGHPNMLVTEPASTSAITMPRRALTYAMLRPTGDHCGESPSSSGVSLLSPVPSAFITYT